ncbi:NPCBM/NEW2 domain-containing protein [Clostridium perfringens]|nr:NPCBM/NEW2 domain-containing protein [Clostridium perfringens]
MIKQCHLDQTSSVIFKVLVDGEEKFNSGVMRSTTPQKYVKVDVKNAKELKLIVNDAWRWR